ncbi:MAG: YkgJ family cysteine cluster protein [Chloroflexi bacterium]|nr:YkgJ family cysteine cluster protein [Chloroflexota bacterium]
MLRKPSTVSSFPKIPEERFAEFHAAFKGGDSWWQVCADCGGECEKHKVGSLMPGEKEFIARSLGLSAASLEDRYLDRVVTPLGNVDVLKLKPGCPFLDADCRCSIRSVKVVLCDAYPIAFEVEGDAVRFFLDPECPISRNRDATRYYEKVAIPALRKLNAAVGWYRAVALYDSLDIDYERLDAGRGDLLTYQSFSLEQLRAAAVETPNPKSQ